LYICNPDPFFIICLSLCDAMTGDQNRHQQERRSKHRLKYTFFLFSWGVMATPLRQGQVVPCMRWSLLPNEIPPGASHFAAMSVRAAGFLTQVSVGAFNFPSRPFVAIILSVWMYLQLLLKTVKRRRYHEKIAVRPCNGTKKAKSDDAAFITAFRFGSLIRGKLQEKD